ncbi:MAG UNVERIFIED_CONTAM: flagellar motor switch protein FliG [Rickettsiaceae bacterium]|jgi:flagellar motor switch protein FliG
MANPQKTNSSGAFSGAQKVAILLLSVSDEIAAKIFALMNEDEVREVSHAMSGLGVISPNMVEAVIQEFSEDIVGNSIFLGNLFTTEKLLTKVMDRDRVKVLMEELKGPQGRNTWEKLANVNEDLLALYLRGEHPQTAALVLSKIAPEHAAKVLSILPEKFAFEVIMRMLNMGAVKKEVIERVEKILRAEFISSVGRTMKRDSCEMIAEIFYNLDRANESKYMTMLEKIVPDSAQKIRDLMFTFEDLVRLDSRGVQALLSSIDKSELSIALKGASEDVKNVFFRHMSQRASRIIIEEIESLGPVRVRDVDEAQSRIVKMVKDLVEKGEIDIAVDGKDEYLP